MPNSILQTPLGRPGTANLTQKHSSKTTKNSPNNSSSKLGRPNTTNKTESNYSVTQPTTASTNNRSGQA